MNNAVFIDQKDFESHVINNCGDKELAEKLSKITRPHGPIYRGIYFNINDLKVGSIYTHWYETVSWSKSFEVAKNFALHWSNVSEGIIEEAYNKKYGKAVKWSDIADEEWEIVSNDFVKVLLIDNDGQGVYANEYVSLSDDFAKEEEVIVVNKIWTITNIRYEENDNLYLVTVKAAYQAKI